VSTSNNSCVKTYQPTNPYCYQHHQDLTCRLVLNLRLATPSTNTAAPQSHPNLTTPTAKLLNHRCAPALTPSTQRSAISYQLPIIIKLGGSI